MIAKMVRTSLERMSYARQRSASGSPAMVGMLKDETSPARFRRLYGTLAAVVDETLAFRVDRVSCSDTILGHLLVASRNGSSLFTREKLHDLPFGPVTIVLISILRSDEAAVTAVLADVELDVRIAGDLAIAKQL